MLDEICPVQFIEGINENGKIERENFIQIRGYQNVAIRFTPNRTFLLSRLEICLVWGNFNKQEEYGVKLCSDYKNNPTDTVLREGKLVFDVTKSGYGWCIIDLNEPIVVFARNNYWLCFDSYDALFSLLKATEGDEILFREYTGSDWFGESTDKYRFMFRFYGRVVPIAS
ncbi:hypothetical protein ACFLV4_05845 [Chloroflexota bacterium]